MLKKRPSAFADGPHRSRHHASMKSSARHLAFSFRLVLQRCRHCPRCHSSAAPHSAMALAQAACHSALRSSRSRHLPTFRIRSSQICHRRISITLLKRLWNRWCPASGSIALLMTSLLDKIVLVDLLEVHVGTAPSACPQRSRRGWPSSAARQLLLMALKHQLIQHPEARPTKKAIGFTPMALEASPQR